MPSRSLLSVQEKLERRWRYVCEAEWSWLLAAIQAYFDLINEAPALKIAVERLCARHGRDEALQTFGDERPGGQLYALGEAIALDQSAAVGAVTLRNGLRDDSCWRTVCEKVASSDFGYRSLHDERLNNQVERFRLYHDRLIQTYLRPLHEFLLDALDANVETLAAIRWFQHWAQWFGASRFEWERRLEDEAVAAGKGKHNYEKRFQLVLFEKLFEYGLHLDISREPSTAAGSPDFTVVQRTSTGPRPIVVEAKILDKETDPKARLGHLQIRRYMDALHADTGYLVLFDLTDRGHHVELPDRLDDLPLLPVGDGRQVFVIHVPCVAQISASKSRPSALKADNFHFELD